MAKLTVRSIEALKPKTAGYKVTADRGLYLRVAPDGSKVWLVRYVVNGKQIQARLPRPYGYDGEGYMTLAQAVSENARIQALGRNGIDFQEQQADAERARVAAKAAALAADKPLRDLFETWLADGVSRKDGNAELRRTFEKDILPTLGDKRIREIADADLLHVLRAVGRTRGAGRTAERMLTEMRQMFRWAIKRQPWRSLLVENGNPAELVDLKQIVPKGYEPGIRERVLSPAEIRELRDNFHTMEATLIVSFYSSKIGTPEVDIHRTLRIQPSQPRSNPTELVLTYVGFSKLSLDVAKIAIGPSVASGFSRWRIFQNGFG